MSEPYTDVMCLAYLKVVNVKIGFGTDIPSHGSGCSRQVWINKVVTLLQIGHRL